MKRRVAVAGLVLILAVGCGQAGAGSTPTAAPTRAAGSSSAYLGQKPPGEYAQRFAAGVIRGELHTAPTFSADGTEAYWAKQGGQIMRVRLVDGQWSEPAALILSPSITDYRDRFIAPGSGRLYFLSDAPLPDSSQPRKENVWYAERVGDGWGEPAPVSQGVNAYRLHWLATANSAGDLYLGGRDDELGDIFVSRYRDGQHQASEKLGEAVNKPDCDETTPYIAPDGTYLIFTRTDSKNSNQIRLYISYAGANGQWSEARLIDRVPYGLSPIVSPDGLYLFFLSSPNGVSWMSASFIEQGRAAQ